jgi:hypothetical protein
MGGTTDIPTSASGRDGQEAERSAPERPEASQPDRSERGNLPAAADQAAHRMTDGGPAAHIAAGTKRESLTREEQSTKAGLPPGTAAGAEAKAVAGTGPGNAAGNEAKAVTKGDASPGGPGGKQPPGERGDTPRLTAAPGNAVEARFDPHAPHSKLEYFVEGVGRFQEAMSKEGILGVLGSGPVGQLGQALESLAEPYLPKTSGEKAAQESASSGHGPGKAQGDATSGQGQGKADSNAKPGDPEQTLHRPHPITNGWEAAQEGARHIPFVSDGVQLAENYFAAKEAYDRGDYAEAISQGLQLGAHGLRDVGMIAMGPAMGGGEGPLEGGPRLPEKPIAEGPTAPEAPSAAKAPEAPVVDAPKAPVEGPKATVTEPPKATVADAPKAPVAEAPKAPVPEGPTIPKGELAKLSEEGTKTPLAEAPKAPPATAAAAAEAPKAPALAEAGEAAKVPTTAEAANAPKASAGPGAGDGPKAPAAPPGDGSSARPPGSGAAPPEGGPRAPVPRGSSLEAMQEHHSLDRDHPGALQGVKSQPAVDAVKGGEHAVRQSVDRNGVTEVDRTVDGGDWISLKRLKDDAGGSVDKRVLASVEEGCQKFDNALKDGKSSYSQKLADGTRERLTLINPEQLVIQVEVPGYDAMSPAEQARLQGIAELEMRQNAVPDGQFESEFDGTMRGVPIRVDLVEPPPMR